MLEYRIVLRRDRNQTKPETLANVAWWCFVDWGMGSFRRLVVVRRSVTFGTLQHTYIQAAESKRSDLCISFFVYACFARSFVRARLCVCVCVSFLCCVCVWVGKCARAACARWCSLARLVLYGVCTAHCTKNSLAWGIFDDCFPSLYLFRGCFVVSLS